MSKRYLRRGVSSKKEDIHNAIRNVDKGLFPNAFCKIVPDILSNDPNNFKTRLYVITPIIKIITDTVIRAKSRIIANV